MLRVLLILSIVSFALCTALPKTYGAAPSEVESYSKSTFSCLDHSAVISIDKDGSDEPGTSACNFRFYCKNEGHVGRYLYSSMVNDGVCDCCDGSDEYDGRVKCENTCDKVGSVAKEAYQSKLAKAQQGLEIKKTLPEKAKAIRAEKQAELVTLKAKLETIRTDLDAAHKVDDEAQERQNKVRQAQDVRESLRKRREAIENKKKALEEAQNAQAAPPSPLGEEPGINVEVPGQSIETPPVDDGINIDEVIPDDEPYNAEEEQQSMNGALVILYGDVVDDDVDSDDDEDDVIGDDDDEDDVIGDADEPGLFSYVLDKLRDTIVKPFSYFAKTSSKSTRVRELESQERDTKNKIEDIETLLGMLSSSSSSRTGRTYGVDDVYLPSVGKCITAEAGSMSYEYCPFDKVQQREGKVKYGGTNAGKFTELSNDDGVDVLKYENGQSCWQGPRRSTTSKVVCDNEEKITDIDEPSTCVYTMVYHTPAACTEEYVALLSQQSQAVPPPPKMDLKL